MGMADIQKHKIETLQICRGLATILVLLAHSSVFIGNLSLSRICLTLGNSAAVFFFILSGLIISYTKHSYWDTPAKFPVYLKERIIRVFPMYWIYLTGAILISFAVFSIFHTHIIDSKQLNTIDLIKNYFMYPYFLSPYYKEETRWPIISQAWSLSYELFFYATFALFIINKRLGLITFGFWLVFIVLDFAKILIPTSFLMKFLLNPDFLEFFMGMIVAYLVLKYGDHLKNLHNLFLGIGTIGLITFWILLGNGYVDFYIFHRLLVFGIPCSLIILGITLWEKYQVNYFKRTRIYSFGVLLGEASYSIYLIHFMILHFIYTFLKKLHLTIINIPVTFIMVSAISLYIGLLCYQIMEKPILQKLKSKLLKNRIKFNSVKKLHMLI